MLNAALTETSGTPRIRWDLIAKAISYYENAGFTYTEVPWVVSPEAIAVTLPPGKRPFQTLDGVLVGSAEQAFLQLALDGDLVPGRYVAASPCFRDDAPDHIHRRHFFKVELIDLSPTSAPSSMTAQDMADIALTFYRSLPGCEGARLVHGPGEIDVQLADVELGSYGERHHGPWRWIFGTGLAEPRFSIATADLGA